MSAVIPRPVGPTIDWNASATTTASRPRMRTHVCPYQVISTSRFWHTAVAARSPEKERPEAPAQSAPPVGGREDGTSKGSVREKHYADVVQAQDGNRLRNANATPGAATPSDAAARIAGRMHPPRRSPAAALVLVVVAACTTVAPTQTPTAVSTPGPTGPAPTGASASGRPGADVYAQIRGDVEGIRGLSPTAAVEPITIDEAQLRKNLEAEFDTQNGASAVADSEDLLQTLGLLPQGSSLRQIMLDFQSGQVAGYYSPERKELDVVSRSGGIGALEKVTYAHEFTHQLQDQHGLLAGLGLDTHDQSDRSMARLALVEGDAVSVQSTWMQSKLTPKELGELLAAALGPSSVEALQRAPA